MKKLILLLLGAVISSKLYAFGLYAGGGGGIGYQNLSAPGNSQTQTSTAWRGFVGYDLFSLMGIEAGYTYFTHGSNLNNLGSPSATAYDLSVTPGFVIPLTQLTVFGRLGVDALSPGLGQSWGSQLGGPLQYNLEWGGGIKFSLPISSLFVRAEYINYGSAPATNNTHVSIAPSALLLDLGMGF